MLADKKYEKLFQFETFDLKDRRDFKEFENIEDENWLDKFDKDKKKAEYGQFWFKEHDGVVLALNLEENLIDEEIEKEGVPV